jgi:signal transduction histidine kinase
MDQVQDEIDTFPDRFGRASIILFALGIVLLSALLATWRVVQDHQLTLRASRHELLLFATTLAKQVESMVRDSVGVAAAGARAMRHAATPGERQQILERQLVGDHYLRALFVLGKDGVVIANREGSSIAFEDLPSRSELQRCAHGVWFGKVVPDDGGALILPVARRVPARRRAHPDGDELWAGAFLRISELDLTYEQLEDLDASVALVTQEGIGLIQLPLSSTQMRNVDISGSEIFHLYLKQPLQKLLLLDGPDVVTGAPRMHAIYRMRELPTFATAARLHSDTFREWRERTQLLTLSFLLWTAVVMALAVRLQLLYNRRCRTLEQVAAAQRETTRAQHAELTTRRTHTRELMLAQERDRQRLAGELHDSVGQHLTMLRTHALQVKRTAGSEEAREHADALVDLASEAIEEVRAVAHNLRPVHLEELGLSTALTVMLERIELSSGLIVHSRIENIDDLLQGEAAVHVYRIVQEATSNVLRHADASNLWVDVIHHEKEVEISIRDDGRGIDESPGPDLPGLGMTSISERSEILGARLDVSANDPQGTRLQIHISRSGT